jgi:hypothetical protein
MNLGVLSVRAVCYLSKTAYPPPPNRTFLHFLTESDYGFLPVGKAKPGTLLKRTLFSTVIFKAADLVAFLDECLTPMMAGDRQDFYLANPRSLVKVTSRPDFFQGGKALVQAAALKGF